MSCPRRGVLQLSLSRQNECGGLLPDCRFHVKESESEDDCVGSTHGNLLSEVWYMVATNQTIARDLLLQGRLRVTENVR